MLIVRVPMEATPNAEMMNAIGMDKVWGLQTSSAEYVNHAGSDQEHKVFGL